MRKHRGFTLIELLVVIAIIAIIAAIAIPAYTEQVRKSRRADAARSVGQLQLDLERWRAENPCYGTTPNPPCATLSGVYPTPPVSDFYTIAIPSATTNAYSITATAKGVQVGDRCGVLTATRDAKPTWANAACN